MGAPSKGLSNTSVVAVGVALALSTLLAAVALQRQGAPIAAALAQRGGCPPPAAATAATAAAAPLPTCGIALGGNPRWADRCDLLADVCVDQGAFVLQGQQYRPVPGRPAALLPALRTPLGGVKYVPPWTGDKVADLQMEVEAGRPYFSFIEVPRVRAARAREGAPDLARPAFSSCTVPVVWLPDWQENFYHAYLETASVLHSLLGAAAWAPHAKLVMVTPEGLAMPAHLPGLLAPLTNLTIESLADFSARGAPATGPGMQAAGSARRDSHEGGRHRCYRQLLWCGRQRWSEPYPVTAYGRRLLRHHGYPTLPPPPSLVVRASARAGGSSAGGSSGIAAGAAAAAAAQPAQQPLRPLRVLFQHRAGATRQLLNVDALVAACSAWQFAPPGAAAGQQPLPANCSVVALGSLEASLAAAQEADVFVGMHGANLMAGFLMRPGGVVVEIWNHGFEEGAAAFLNAAHQDPELGTSWWTVRVADPALSQPGPYEAAGQQPAEHWARDRSARVPWDALRLVLEAAVTEAALGGTDAYRAAAASRSQVWTLLPGRLLRRPGGAEQPY